MEDEDSRRFIDLATRPLAEDPAARDGAKAELWGRIAHGGAVAGDDGVAEAGAQLEACASSRTRHRVIVVAVLLLGVAAWLGCLLRPAVSEFRTLDVFHDLPVWRGARQAVYLEEQAKSQWLHPPPLAMPSGAGSEKWLAEMEALRAAHPDDPAIYHEFVCRYRVVRKVLPPDFHATWTRVDPDNAVWPMLECSVAARDAIGRSAGSPRYVTINPPEMEASITAFREAARMKHYRDHGERLAYRQLAAFPPPRSLAEARTRWLYSSFPSSMYHFNHGGEATLRVKLRELADAGDSVGFEALLGEWKTLVRMSVEDLESDDSGLGDRAMDMAWTARDLVSIHAARGEHEKRRNMGELEKFLRSLRFAPCLRAEQAVALRREQPSTLSYFPGARICPLEAPPDFFEARQMAEHAVGDRFVGLIGAALAWLGLAGVAIAAFRPRGNTGKLGDGVAPLFRAVDQAWVVGLGIILPVALWWVVMSFTPWNGREPGFAAPFTAWLFQVAALYLMVAAALLEAVRWRWAKRAGFLALRPRFLAAGWVMPLLAFAVFLAAGILQHNAPQWLTKQTNICMLCGIGGIPLLWLLWHAAVLVFAPRAGALGPLLIARSLLWPGAAVVVLLLGTAMWMQERERYWMGEDAKWEIDVSREDASRFKGDVAAEIRGTVERLLEP